MSDEETGEPEWSGRSELDELRAKIRTVIERVGVTDMAVDIVIDLVARGLGRLGGRPPTGSKPPPNRFGRGSKRVPKPRESDNSGDLFSDLGSPPDPSKPLPEKLASMSDGEATTEISAFERALRWFLEAWLNRYGVAYEPNNADRNQLGRLLRGLRPELFCDLRRAFLNYLADDTPFVAGEQRHSLRWFCTSGGFNKYRTAPPPKLVVKQPAPSGLCAFHLRAEAANRPARVHDPICSECRHVAALMRPRNGAGEPLLLAEVPAK